MPNCQTCGEESGQDEVCETCAHTNKQPAIVESSGNRPRTFLIVIIAVIVVIALIFAGASYFHNEPAGTGSMASMTATSNTTTKLTFGTFAPAPVYTEYKIILTPTTGTAIEYWFDDSPTNADTPMEATSGTAVHGILAYHGNHLFSGEYMEVTGLEPGMAYTISVYYKPTDSFYSLTGETTFQMPP